MTTLHLGVLDVPYTTASGVSTGDVAEWLEKKYSVVGEFVELHAHDIEAAVGDAVLGALETLLMGGQVGDPFAEAAGEIEKKFRTYLDTEEMAGKLAGVPTMAALKGVNRRMKSKRGARRPSFIDTGLYRQSFRAWAD